MTTNLSGSLSEFSLAEVLSLLGMGGRTARMQVTSATAVGTVHLVDGRISSATADSTRAGLLRGVVAALPVPADDLAHALQSEDPVRTLVEAGVVDRDSAQQVASEHCTEAVGEMLDWTAGEFAVWVGSHDPADIGVRLEVHELVGAARERAQEWHDLRAALPESGSVLALVPDVAQAPVVDMEDWAVLARVDGRRTLSEVLAAMGTSPLAAGNRLVQLMGRGLVAVHVGGGDAEQERAHHMLDAFEAGAPVEGERVIELVASAEPEFVPDVHDLFVTEPEAVEEWQVAGSEPWVIAEREVVMSFAAEDAPVADDEHVPVADWAALVAPEFPAGPEPVLNQAFAAAVEPMPYELEPVDFASESVTFAEEGPAFETESVTYELDPVGEEVDPVGFEVDSVAYEVDPVTYEVAPVGFEVDPVAYEVGPVAYEPEPEATAFEVDHEAPDMAPVTFEVEPAAEAVAETFAWSPWAQEMGLGEAPVSPVAQPTPFEEHGFADMVEDNSGHGHTDAFPVPQAPVAGVEDGADTSAGLVDDVAQFVPQPRDPGDGVVDPSTYALAVGAHAAGPEYLPAPEATAGGVGAAGTGGPQVETAPDPLAGGLLAHLMSSVRGL